MCHETPLLPNQSNEFSRNFLGRNCMAQSKTKNISDSHIELKMSCLATSWCFALKECIFKLVIPFSACRMRYSMSSLSFLSVKSVESNADLSDSGIFWICWHDSHISSWEWSHTAWTSLLLSLSAKFLQRSAIVETSATYTWNEKYWNVD